MTKSITYGLLFIMLAGLVVIACGDCPVPPDDAFATDLLAGKTMDVGNVTIWNNATHLFVLYEVTEDGWYLTETHLDVQCDWDDIPHTVSKKGDVNPIPGHFTYNDSFEPSENVRSWCQAIPKDALDECSACDDTVFIAAHAVVGRTYDSYTETETAWGNGTRFNTKGSWGMYFTYTVREYLELVEPVTVYANSISGVDSINLLETGEPYRFEATGTWRDNSQPAHYIDAEYTTFDTWASHLDGTTNWGPNQKDLQVNDMFVEWGSYSSEHTYSFDFVGIGSPVKFRIFDGGPTTGPPIPTWYGDNIGSLTVNIYRVYC